MSSSIHGLLRIPTNCMYILLTFALNVSDTMQQFTFYTHLGPVENGRVVEKTSLAKYKDIAYILENLIE